jgi:hypothetical protein
LFVSSSVDKVDRRVLLLMVCGCFSYWRFFRCSAFDLGGGARRQTLRTNIHVFVCICRHLSVSFKNARQIIKKEQHRCLTSSFEAIKQTYFSNVGILW